MSLTTPPPGGADGAAPAAHSTEWRVLLVYRHYASGFVYYPWMLARAGLAVDVVAAAGHPVGRARSVRRSYVAAANDASFREIVSTRLAVGNYALMLAMDEPSRNLFYRGAADPVVEPYLPVPRANELAGALSDKEKFQSWCERHGVPTPQTRIVTSVDEALAFAREWRYPVVLKGAMGMGGKAVRVCRNEPETRAAHRELGYGGGHVLAQRFVNGAVGSCSFVALRGQVGSWTASEKHIALAKGLGPSAVRRIRTDAELGRIVEQVAAAGEVTGVTGFDWMEGRPGEFLVIDPHFGRCTPPAAISHYAGVDVGMAVRDLLEKTGRVQTPRHAGLIVAMFPQFLELTMQGGGWTLLRRANPFSRNVRYHLGPRSEMRLSLRVALSYVIAGARVWLGRWRSAVQMGMRRSRGERKVASGVATPAQVRVEPAVLGHS